MSGSNHVPNQNKPEPKVTVTAVRDAVLMRRRARGKWAPALLGAIAGLAIGFYFLVFAASESIPAPIGGVTAFLSWLLRKCLGDSEAAAFATTLLILPLVCAGFGALTGVLIRALANALRRRSRVPHK